MVTRTLATAAIGAFLIGPVHAQRASRYVVTDESDLTRTLSFVPGGDRFLDVRNISGFIHVEGTNEPAVQMSIRKTVRAETRDDLADGQREVRLEFKDSAPRVEAVVTDRRGHVCGEPWNDDGNWRDRVR